MKPTESLSPLLEGVTLRDNGELEPLIVDHAAPSAEDQLEYSEADRLIAGLALLVANLDDTKSKTLQGRLQQVLADIDALISLQLNKVLHEENFHTLEATWRALENLTKEVNFGANIQVDLLDVTKEELGEDLETNAVDISQAAIYQQVYIQEYDQYGGFPFSAMIGLFEFENTRSDIEWLETMGKVANAAHAPFITAASPKFFGQDTAELVGEIKDLQGELQELRYGRWNTFRRTEAAAYVGLTFPRHILREPYNRDTNPCKKLDFFVETPRNVVGVPPDRNGDGYLWGNSAILVAQNLARSFETSGWCQYIRGPKGGGDIKGLPIHTYEDAEGARVAMMPVEIAIPDYRELAFAEGGFIPLIFKKGTADAAFFSVQAAKTPMDWEDPLDRENSQLVCNLAYTMSITRIAHYIRVQMREYIGSTAEETYIQRRLENWLMSKVTTVQDPDRITLRKYPFKAAEISVTKRSGEIGRYDCVISVLPHIQFEGLDVELRLEAGLG